MHIVYVSDGKAGHRSQALGLYKALQRQSTEHVSFEEVSIEQLPVFSLFLSRFRHASPAIQQEPDYIFGVGSHTQLRVLLLGKVYPKAKTLILMKPNFPFSWFDYVVIPEHDDVQASDHVIITKGALNPIVNRQQHQAGRILIALGGASKRHAWNENKVLDAIQNIVQDNPETEIILTTSRRTPSEFISLLQQQKISSMIQIFPVDETPQGWIFEEMQKAEAVWVTEDSVSMIFEALTAGCKVGVIKTERIKQDRITASIDQIIDSGLVSTDTQLKQLPFSPSFKEADHVAEIILQHP